MYIKNSFFCNTVSNCNGGGNFTTTATKHQLEQLNDKLEDIYDELAEIRRELNEAEDEYDVELIKTGISIINEDIEIFNSDIKKFRVSNKVLNDELDKINQEIAEINGVQPMVYPAGQRIMPMASSCSRLGLPRIKTLDKYDMIPNAIRGMNYEQDSIWNLQQIDVSMSSMDSLEMSMNTYMTSFRNKYFEVSKPFVDGVEDIEYIWVKEFDMYYSDSESNTEINPNDISNYKAKSVFLFNTFQLFELPCVVKRILAHKDQFYNYEEYREEYFKRMVQKYSVIKKDY